MNFASKSLHDAVNAALLDLATEVMEDRYGCWQFRCEGPFSMRAVLEGDWLQLRTPFAQGHVHGEAVVRCSWEILQRNGLLAGGAKLVTTPDRAVIFASVELPLFLNAMPALTPLLHQAIEDLKEAAQGKSVVRRAYDDSERANLAELCAAAGWQCHSRGSGSIAVPLESDCCVAQAILTNDNALRATVNLYRSQRPLPELSRQAVAVMLMQLGSHVRAVRPAVQTESVGETLVLQAHLRPKPSARELNSILAALSVAVRICQREVALLSDEKMSSRYLAAHGRSVNALAPA